MYLPYGKCASYKNDSQRSGHQRSQLRAPLGVLSVTQPPHSKDRTSNDERTTKTKDAI
jgi:hypothetical protein